MGTDEQIEIDNDEQGRHHPPLYLLVKDHKEPREDGVPKTRPVVSGNQSLNVHLNNLLAEILEPIASAAEDSPEVISTEHRLHIIDSFNDTS